MSLSPSITESKMFKRFLETLIAGDRDACRRAVSAALECGVDARSMLVDLCWPATEAVRNLYREDHLSRAQVNLATRLNRMIVDRLAGELEQKPRNGKKVLVFCGDDEPEELGGQMCADLFEADGWEAKFAGGGRAERRGAGADRPGASGPDRDVRHVCRRRCRRFGS